MKSKLLLLMVCFVTPVYLSAGEKSVGSTKGSSGQALTLNRFAFASGGVSQVNQVQLSASIGQHQHKVMTNGPWVLHAGIITPNDGWPNDLIFSDSYEFTSGE